MLWVPDNEIIESWLLISQASIGIKSRGIGCREENRMYKRPGVVWCVDGVVRPGSLLKGVRRETEVENFQSHLRIIKLIVEAAFYFS